MELAASGIAFVQAGVGAGKAILRAIQLWEQVRQLPNELKARVGRLKAFEKMLRQVETELARHPQLRARPTAQQSLEYAREAEAALCAHVEKLAASILGPKSQFRRRVNSFKIVALKKEEVAALEGELSWAMELMHLSISLFHMAKSELSEEIIVNETSARVKEYTMNCQDDVIQKTAQAVVDMMKAEQGLSKKTEAAKIGGNQTTHLVPAKQPTRTVARSSCFETTVFGKYSFRRSKLDEGWTASIQVPWSQCVRELRWTGWQYCFYSYNIRPTHSPVFQAATNGDLAELMKLFKTGQASPFDRDEHGYSLLYLAAKNERLEVCRALIKRGVPADDERERHGYKPIDAIVESRKNFPAEPDANHAALVSLFRSAAVASDTLTTERLFNFVKEFADGDDFLRVYQTRFLIDYGRLPIRDRAEAVRLGAFVVHSNTTYRRLLRPDFGRSVAGFTPDAVRGSVDEGFSLVHSAAVALGKRLADELQYDPRAFRARTYTPAWSDVVVETVEAATDPKAGADDLLHRLETVVPLDRFCVPVWRGTPLISLIGGALCRLSTSLPVRTWDRFLQLVLRQWLRDLAAAGVDLLEYGRRETLVHKALGPEVKGAFDSNSIIASRGHVRCEQLEESREDWMRDVKRRAKPGDGSWTPVWLVGFDYGPSPDDWRIRWLVESEAFAGEFWRAVEAPPRGVMPGSWVD